MNVLPDAPKPAAPQAKRKLPLAARILVRIGMYLGIYFGIPLVVLFLGAFIYAQIDNYQQSHSQSSEDLATWIVGKWQCKDSGGMMQLGAHGSFMTTSNPSVDGTSEYGTYQVSSLTDGTPFVDVNVTKVHWGPKEELQFAEYDIELGEPVGTLASAPPTAGDDKIVSFVFHRVGPNQLRYKALNAYEDMGGPINSPCTRE